MSNTPVPDFDPEITQDAGVKNKKKQPVKTK